MNTIEFVPTGYPSDLTDSQWEEIAEFYAQGPNSEYHKRSLVNGVLYLVNNGCKWRALPHDYPPYSTVHSRPVLKPQFVVVNSTNEGKAQQVLFLFVAIAVFEQFKTIDAAINMFYFDSVF